MLTKSSPVVSPLRGEANLKLALSPIENETKPQKQKPAVANRHLADSLRGLMLAKCGNRESHGNKLREHVFLLFPGVSYLRTAVLASANHVRAR